MIPGLRVAALIGLGFAALSAVPFEALAADFPRGPWRMECRRASMDGTVLTASCPNRAGEFVRSSIETRLCKSGVQNVNGRLRCRPQSGAETSGSAGSSVTPGAPLPAGPWRGECRRASMDGTVLTAFCPNRNGRFVQSSIQTRLCRRGVQNVNGQLRCVGVSGRSAAPPQTQRPPSRVPERPPETRPRDTRPQP